MKYNALIIIPTYNEVNNIISLVSKIRSFNIIEDILANRGDEAQCANGSVVISSCIIAIEAIAIGALMFYACRMRKKTKHSYEERKRESDFPND